MTDPATDQTSLEVVTVPPPVAQVTRPARRSDGAVWVPYGLAVIGVGVAGLLWTLVGEQLGFGSRWLLFYPAVVVAACVGGLGPALVATGMALLAGTILSSAHPLSGDPSSFIGVGVLIVTGLLAGLLCQRMQRVHRRLEAETWVCREAKAALGITEQRFHAIFEQAAIGICMATLEGEMKLVNQRLCNMLGYSREELLQRSYKDITYPEDWPAQVVQATRLKAGEIASYSMEKRYIRKDGSVIWANLTCSTIRDNPTYVVAIIEDIEDRKRVEDALKRVKDRYSALFDRSLDCVYLLDFSGRFIDANPAALDLLGYTKEEIGSVDLRMIIDAEQMTLARQRVDEILRVGHTTASAEFRARRKDGRIVFVETKGSIILHDGRPVAIQGIARDMTARKQAEEALRESEEKFRSLAENMHASVGMVQGTSFIYANQYMGQMLGYTVEELLKMEFPQLVHPSHREMMIELAHRRQQGERVPHHYEFLAVTKTGEQRWVDFSSAAILYKGKPTIIGTGFDITARKLVEEKLQTHTRGLKLLANTATRLLGANCPREVLKDVFDDVATYLGVGIYLNYLVTADGGRLHLHTARGLDEATAKQLEFVDFGQTLCATAAQEKRPVIVENVQDAVGRKVEGVRGLGIRAYACHPLMVSNRVIGTLSFCSLDRNRFDEEELELMRTVTHQVAMALEHEQLTAELERRAHELAEASQAKDHFMAILSHELRTPLTPVLAATNLLERDPAMPESASEYVAVIRRNAELEARLIDDLLDVTRIVRGKIDLNRRPVELWSVVCRAVEVCREDIEARQLHFGLDPTPATPCWVEADADRLQQVFWNLLKNAIKFTPTGGCVGIHCNRLDGHVAVEIIDSGEGIAPEAMGRIFKPFEQAERAITRQFGGLGLGLAITSALVELHGGKISAHSEGKGKGSTFRVELPLVTDAKLVSWKDLAGEGSGAPERAAEPGGPLRVLLVEDHVDSARVLTRLLQGAGYQVEYAGDVASALELAERAREAGTPFDLLLSDLGLPDASGNDLMRVLRERGQTLAGVALSGYGMASDMEQSRAAGFAEHVTKPVSFPVLQKAIAKATHRMHDGRLGHGAP